MRRTRLVLPPFLVALVAALFAACSSSSHSDGGTDAGNEASVDSGSDAPCTPPPFSCDAPAPMLWRVETQNDCVDPSIVQLADVCSTSVNRCYPSGGIGAACAVSPDGGIYVGDQSDNYMYSADGWRFEQPGGLPAAPPEDQRVTPDQLVACERARCLPSCDGGYAPWGALAFCPKDAGGD